jgi:hypothetical protein
MFRGPDADAPGGNSELCREFKGVARYGSLGGAAISYALTGSFAL